MAFRFNPIACREWMGSDVELEAAGMTIGRIVHDAVRCASCGSTYALLVPLSLPEQELPVSQRRFQRMVNDTCGNHSPILQLGS